LNLLNSENQRLKSQKAVNRAFAGEKDMTAGVENSLDRNATVQNILD